MSENKNVQSAFSATHKLRLTSSGLFGSLFFGWVSPLFQSAKPPDLNFDWMPDLPRIYSHDHYAPRIRCHFDRLYSELGDRPTPTQKKLFFIKLVFRTFRWDIILITLLSIVEKILIFSAAYVFQVILEMPATTDPAWFFQVFFKCAVVLLALKALFSVVTEALGFYIVG